MFLEHGVFLSIRFLASNNRGNTGVIVYEHFDDFTINAYL